MKVFKFGGASVKSAEAVRNVKSILDIYKDEKLIVVVSAMGKTTNALEEVVAYLYAEDTVKYDEQVEKVRNFHLEIMNFLFDSKNHPIFKEINTIFDNLKEVKKGRIAANFDFQYDQIVSIGELVSSKIISAFLAGEKLSVCWRDARTFIRTNNRYRSAEIDWGKTQELIDSEMKKYTFCQISVTQGFIGHTDEGFTTTLGREGSDFTAAILAYCTNAESVTIWKDVPGMLNADPKYFSSTVKLDMISFKEAIELAYYGASVIHPKTIQPLQNKNLPLYVKSFVNPLEEGTVIQSLTTHDDLVPSYIFKLNQVLLSLTSRDFSFVVEENLSDIFKKLAQVGASINLMQNSAVSFTVCLDTDQQRLAKLLELLQDDYIVQYNDHLELVTIRHYDQATIDKVTKGKTVLMEQKTRKTVRIVMENKF